MTNIDQAETAGLPLWRREFPDFPVEDMPAIPAGFEDTSWWKDACPSFACALKNGAALEIWTDFKDPARREAPTRFSVQRRDPDGSRVKLLAEGDEWDEIAAFVAQTLAADAQ